MEPVHIVTDKENIANIVLLPGDPLRAKYIAENFLTDAKLVNTIRNMFAYTGTYKGHKITVMGSGMGMPSMGIYSYELFHFYNVDRIIRIGTSGSNKPEIKVGDTILSTGAYTPSNFAYQWGKYNDHFLKTNEHLNELVRSTAKEENIALKEGPTLTSDVFDVYSDIEHIRQECPINDELVATEMEAFGLLHVARIEHKEATVLMTVVDSKFEPEMQVTPEERQTKLNNMIKLALDSIIK